MFDELKKKLQLFLESTKEIESLAKAKIEEGLSPEDKRSVRSIRNSTNLAGTSNVAGGRSGLRSGDEKGIHTPFVPKTGESIAGAQLRAPVVQGKGFAKLKEKRETMGKVKDQHRKILEQLKSMKKPDLAMNEEMEKAGRCWDGYKPVPGKKPYSKGSCEPVEKADKPFHGYNPKKHSKSGGLNDSYRKKYNRENGSHLKRPSGDKTNPRHKSFCARMSGVKGPTSKDGKLTPKGAALKRWHCSKNEHTDESLCKASNCWKPIELNKTVHEQHSRAPQGQSVAGHDFRMGKKIKEQGRKDQFGFSNAAKEAHIKILEHLKNSKKADLPKSELAKQAEILYDSRTTPTHKPFPQLKAAPKEHMPGNILDYKKIKEEFRQKNKWNRNDIQSKKPLPIKSNMPEVAGSVPTPKSPATSGGGGGGYGKLYDPEISGKITDYKKKV